MSAPSDSGRAGTGPSGEVSAPDHWSEAETWAWAEIRAGRPADFNARFGDLDPKDPEGWDDTRKLGQEFLETILLHAPYRGAIPRRGVRIVGAWFREPIDLANAHVTHELWLDYSRFEASVQLTDMKALGVLSLEGSRFGGKLDMDRLHADSILFMHGGAEFGEVILNGAKVGGQLAMNGSKFGGTLDMELLHVDGSLVMRGAEFEKEVQLFFATVGSNLDISGARFVSVDLTGTKITGELRLGSGRHSATTWVPGARLVLRNSHVGALQDRAEAWPESLELEGFTYGRLGGFGGAGAEDDMAQRPADWFIDWLAKDRSFSPQPYQQLAEVFRAAGQTGKAHDVLYAGRERERRAAEGVCWWTSGLKWWGMGLLKVTIGYGLGHRYFWALRSVVGLVLLGAIVLAGTGEGPAHGMPWGLSYSLDHLLPVVQLIKSHYAIELDGFARYYFYVHKLMGYVLASFLIAGLAGLTQK